MIKEIVVVCVVALNLLSVNGKTVARKTSDVKVPVTGNFEQDLEKYLEVYHPTYVRSLDEDYEKRVNKFRKVYNEILNHDPVASGYRLGFSHLSFKTEEELDSMVNKVMAKGQKKAQGGIKHRVTTDVSNLPDYFSWDDEGKVTPVKNQGICGSCYTYAAAAALETAIAIKCGLTIADGNLQSVSTKQFIDCSYGYGFIIYTNSDGYSWDVWSTDASPGNNGCGGGYARACYAYLNMTHDLENEYYGYSYDPWGSTTNGDCGYNDHDLLKEAIPVVGYVVVPNDEDAMMDALYNNGALACAIDVNPLESYAAGVYSGACSQDTNHAITVVGYGTDESTNTPYWLIKNSWDTTWGDNGYFKLERGINQCGIATDCVYPILSDASC